MMRKMLWPGAITVAAAAGFLAIPAGAQCSDPSTHFRGGLWKQWILQLEPGPVAQQAISRVIDEINAERGAASMPRLIFDPTEVLVISVIEENNPRGPDGALLADRTPNREVFLATFAADEASGYQAVFLADPLRSNADLTAKGVPGVTATVERSIRSSVVGSESLSSTRWSAQTGAGDRIRFSAEYPGSAVTIRGRTPGSTSYLACNLATTLDVVFRSRPLETFALYDRTQTAVLLDLTLPGVELGFRVRSEDPDVHAMFNDPANQPLLLIEADRVVRIERK